MKFWKKLQIAGHVVVAVIAILALVAMLMQPPASDRSVPTTPAQRGVAPQPTQGL